LPLECQAESSGPKDLLSSRSLDFSINNKESSILRPETINISELQLIDTNNVFLIQMTINNIRCVALYDSGCTGMVISEKFISNHPSLPMVASSSITHASLADQRIVPIKYMCPNAELISGPTRDNYDLIVAPIRYDIIVGLPWITKNNASVDWDNRILNTRHGPILEVNELPSINELLFSDDVEFSPDDDDLKCYDKYSETMLINEFQVENIINNSCINSSSPSISTPNSTVHPLAAKLIKEYSDRLRDELPDELPPRRPYDPKLEFRQKSELKNRPMYRMSQSELISLREILEKLIKRGQIYECDAPFASPAFLIKKKLSGHRLLVDMRQLNDAIKDYSWPLPNILSLLDRSKGCKVWSTLDMVSGYQQMRVHPDSEILTAFRCPLGVFAWRTLPQGCKVSPAAFSRMMQSVFKELPFVCVYLDDLLVCSKDEAEHEQHLRQVFDTLRKNHLYASREKTKLFQKRVEYLGYVLSEDGIHTDPKKIAAIKDWPVPKNPKQIRQLLGSFGYYRRFVPNFSNVAAPLILLTGKDIEFKWTDECQNAMDKLKEFLCSAPILRPFDEDLKTFVMTDASDFAVGAVLEQMHPDGRHPVEYIFKKLISYQQKYEVHIKELYAIVTSLEHWNHYISGRHVVFETDHHPLKYIKTQKNLSHMHARWLDTISEYDIEIRYKPGKENTIADGLSRRPDLEISNIQTLDVDREMLGRVRQGYTKDSYFDSIYYVLNHPEEPVQKELITKVKRYRLDNGLLYYIADNNPRLCIPNFNNLREELIRENHDCYSVIRIHLHL